MNRRDVLKLAAVAPVSLLPMPAPNSDWVTAKVKRFEGELLKAGIASLPCVYRRSVEPNLDRCSGEVRLYRITLSIRSGIKYAYVKELAVDMSFCSRLELCSFRVVRALSAMEWTEIPLDRRAPPLTPVVF